MSLSDSCKTTERAVQTARSSYGRLLALLSARSGDILVAEDALADAFHRALETWPQKGVPENPEAWLFTVARNRQRDEARRNARTKQTSLDAIGDVLADDTIDPYDIPDERLKLMFVCAHPAIDQNIRTPLMLQTVLGLEARDIAQAYLVTPDAMAQRLVRAKKKIKQAGIPFALPQIDDMQIRLEPVLEAIYGAYSADWLQCDTLNTQEDFASEALFLANLLARLLPDEAEVLGLSALIGLSYARRKAVYDPEAGFVPLEKQDVELWDKELIAHAETQLRRAPTVGPMGRFQLEAAIQSVHCDRLKSGKTDWLSLARLYEGLHQTAPTIGAAVGRAAAVGNAVGAEAGLACLDQIDQNVQKSFQPAWATRAHLLARLDRHEEAAKAFKMAISLTQPTALKDYLAAQLLASEMKAAELLS